MPKYACNLPTVEFESRIRSARRWNVCLSFKAGPAALGRSHEMANDDRRSSTRSGGIGSQTPDPIAWLTRDYTDDDKNFVTAYVNSLVRKGRADLRMLRNGNVELRLTNGRVFHLGDDGLTRVA